MTVKDFLAIQKFEEVFQKYMELYPITELEQLEFRHHHEIEDINMLVTKKKTAYERVWNDLLDTKINRDSTSILVANKYLDTDLDGEIAELVSSSVYNYSDILTIGILDSFYDDKAQEIEGYSYLFIEWEDVLGYTFACSTLMLVQPEEVAAGLLHELTMMGLTRE